MADTNVRTCGPCTACCKTLPVRELKKPAGVWCPSCNIGQACRISAERPKGCREFACQWLKGSWENGDRPDKVKVVTDFVTHPAFGDTIVLYEVSSGGLDRRFATQARDAALARPFAVLMVPVHGDATLFVGHTHKIPDEVVLEDGRNVRVERR